MKGSQYIVLWKYKSFELSVVFTIFVNLHNSIYFEWFDIKMFDDYVVANQYQ